jgi:hypothetical protein
MKQILICAGGGCCGHFIASLIRTMQYPDIYITEKQRFSISNNGSCDHMAFAGTISSDYMRAVLNVFPYPESNENGSIIQHALSQPETTYFKCLSIQEKNNDTVNVLHYWWPENIKKFLSIDNVHIIMVRAHQKDYRLVAVNKINKNFDSVNDNNLADYKFYYKSLLDEHALDTTELDNLTSMIDLPNSVKELLYKAWENSIHIRSKSNPVPNHHDRLDVLYVDDIYNNREKVIALISKVMKLEANDSTYKLYDDYMLAQKDILNYIEKNQQ